MLFAGKRARPPGPVRIGIAGLGHNTGVTTACIGLANYLCSKHRKSTAYIELGSAQIGSLAEMGRTGKGSTTNPKLTCFQIHEVDYYPQVNISALPSLYTADYRYFILDFGVFNSYLEAEFLRCDQKILVCDPAPWKQDLFRLLLQDVTQDKALQRTITLLGKGISGRSSLLSHANYAYRILDFPYIQNPFLLTPEVFEFFEKLITGV